MSKSILEKPGLKRTTTVQANSTAVIAEVPAVTDVPSYSDTLSYIKESAISAINSIRGVFGSRVKDVLPANDNNSPAITPEKDFNDEITAAFSTLSENRGKSARVAQKRESIDYKFAYVEPSYETAAPDLSQVFTKSVTVESKPEVPQTKRSRINPALEDVNNYVRELDDRYYDELAAGRARGRLTNLGLYMKQGWNALKSIIRPNAVIEQAKAAVREAQIEAEPALRAVNETVQELDNQYFAEIEARKARGRLKNIKLWGEHFWDKLKWTVAPGHMLSKAVQEDEPQAKVIELPVRRETNNRGIYRQYVRPLAYAATVAGASIGLKGSQADVMTDTTEPVYQTVQQSKPEPVIQHATYKPNSKPVFRATPIVNKVPATPTPKVNSVPVSPKRVRSTYKDNPSYDTEPYVYRSPFTRPGHSECHK